MANIKKHWSKRGYNIKFCQFKKRLIENNVVFLVTKQKFFDLIYPHICAICEQKSKVITLDSLNSNVYTNENVYPVCMNCKKRKGKQEYKIPYNLRIKF